MSQTITDSVKAAEELGRIVDGAKRVVFFGGAGVSTASGIPDFRSADGLYHQKFAYPPEEMLGHDFYYRHTEEFYDFYRAKMIALDAKPNQAHLKLAELEAQGQAHGGRHAEHRRPAPDGWLARGAGAARLGAPQHLPALRARALGRVGAGTTGVPRCEECGGIIKPDVVLYEESLDEDVLMASVNAIASADVLIIGGTSLVVYPAAGLVRYFNGDNMVICNLQPTPQDASADLVCACDIAKAFDF